MNAKNNVLESFISMTEKVANGKTNVLDFGSENMKFYRGEIHMIKMIGDNPGIYSSEMARKFGITRAVVYKTVLKLEKRALIIKVNDESDKKKTKLFLTEDGEKAYKFHEQYHNNFDKALFDFLDSLNEDELQLIQKFLNYSNKLIDNHF
ncbi:MarR family winged helix-turn-helix transcriptional regulator [Vallitalea guaymasensis]|uniref:MarR family winged helix-turn-helix transcriptional regulator n=1 Tax=Vallitalea guaymasensis TaxID=1185412 RepID=UPI002357E252|nr:MarR family transcriptional regulator [Vallitalea guaymasensis]